MPVRTRSGAWSRISAMPKMMQSLGDPEHRKVFGAISSITTSRRSVIDRDAPDLFSLGAMIQISSLKAVAISRRIVMPIESTPSSLLIRMRPTGLLDMAAIRPLPPTGRFPYSYAGLVADECYHLPAGHFPEWQSRYGQPPIPTHSRYVKSGSRRFQHRGNELSCGVPETARNSNRMRFHDTCRGLRPDRATILPDHRFAARKSRYRHCKA